MSAYLACMGSVSEIIQMSPVVHSLRTHGHRVYVLHAGLPQRQTDQLYEFFDMEPDARITLLRHQARLSDLTAELLTRMDTHLQHASPDVVLVQGDTTCAMAGALAASCQDVPVAHLDAGVRTQDQELFPEDMNRALVGRMSRWHFTTSQEARQNLMREGANNGHVHLMGHTSVDAARWARLRIQNFGLKGFVAPEVQRFLRLHAHEQLLLVSTQAHEHWGKPLQRLAAAVAGLLQLHPTLTVVWAMPSCPQAKADVDMGLATVPVDVRRRLCMTGSMPYPQLIQLLDACHFVLADTAPLQRAASALQKPVLIAGDHATSHALVEAGGALVIGPMAHQIIDQISELLDDPVLVRSMQSANSPFGDGQAAQHVAEVLSAETEPRMAIEKRGR